MSQVMEILTWLISLGPKLPSALAIIQQIVDDVQRGATDLAALFGSQTLLKAAAPVSLTNEESAKLDECVAICEESEPPAFGAAPVKGMFMDLIQLLMANPQLLALILSLFKK